MAPKTYIETLMTTTILIVDDEPAILDVLSYNLEKAHYRVLKAQDGEQALALASTSKPDLIILDLMLPGLDGFEVCRALRKQGETPIIMLTALDAEVDRVLGLELGADDYVVKPFSPRELMARVKTVLRRARKVEAPPEQPMRIGELSLDPGKREVSFAERPVLLSALEFDLLAMLMRHADRVLTREQLLTNVWGYDFPGDSRTVDSTVKRLRGRLKAADPRAAQLLVTVRGVGYRMTESG